MSEAALSIHARIPPRTGRSATDSGFQPHDSPGALPRLSGVSHAREQPTQLDRGGELAATIECGTDGGSFGPRAVCRCVSGSLPHGVR
jgi:hypothetical protein